MSVIENIQLNLEQTKRDKKYSNIRKRYNDLQKVFTEEQAKNWILEVCEVSAKFKHLLTQPFCIWDTETTGINSDDEIIEIGILDSLTNEGIELLIKPTKLIAKAAENVHGISNKMLEDKNHFSAHYEEIVNFFNQYELSVAYNGEFDQKLIAQTCFKYRLEQIQIPKVYDPLRDISLFVGQWNNKYNNFKYLKLEGGHRALGDCRQLLKAMYMISTLDCDSLKEEYDIK